MIVLWVVLGHWLCKFDSSSAVSIPIGQEDPISETFENLGVNIKNSYTYGLRQKDTYKTTTRRPTFTSEKLVHNSPEVVSVPNQSWPNTTWSNPNLMPISASDLPASRQGTNPRSTDLRQPTHWNWNISEMVERYDSPLTKLPTTSEEETYWEKYERSTSVITTFVVVAFIAFIIGLCWTMLKKRNSENEIETRTTRLTGSVPHAVNGVTSGIHSPSSNSWPEMRQHNNAGNIPVIEGQWQRNFALDMPLDNRISQFSHNGTSRAVVVINVEPVPGSSSGINEGPPGYDELYADWSGKGQLPPKYEELSL